MMNGEKVESKKEGGYGKRPLWQWILIYLVIGAVVYGVIYYFILASRGGATSSSPVPSPQSGPFGY